jgi:hypothetical protein
MIRKLKSKFSKLSFLLDSYRYFFDRVNITQDDLISSRILSSIINNHPVLPFTIYSLNFYGINLIINDIIIHNRRVIIELGSGTLSIVLARLAKLNNLDLEIISIEEDKVWSNIINERLISEKIDSYCQSYYVPRNNMMTFKNRSFYWYDESLLKGLLSNKKIDQLIIDGPKSNQNYDRQPALSFFYSYLNTKSFGVFLDDCNRNFERDIIQNYIYEFNIECEVYRNKLAFFKKGSPYYISPAWHTYDVKKVLKT